MKEYKTDEELIDYLKSKNVKIKNEIKALKLIEKYSYYSIINSYKLPFKDINNNYRNNVTFEEICALYDFDKNLKLIFLHYSLEIEINIKTLLANQIASQYGIKDYLDINNLDTYAKADVKKRIINRLNEEIQNNNGTHTAITHYMNKYGYVPPFVLVKILTFGVINRFYGVLSQSDRQAISKKFKISDNLLKQILRNLSMIRNISAHNDKLYSFRSKNYVAFKKIDSNYICKDNTTNLYMIIKCMEFLLDGDQTKNMKKQINKQIKLLSKKLKSIDIRDILNIMGFPMNKKRI